MGKTRILVVALLLGLPVILASPLKEQLPTPTLSVNLASLGYNPPKPPSHTDREVFHDLTILMQESGTNFTFVDRNVAAVYFTRPSEKNQHGSSSDYQMEVFFVNTDSGKLIERRIWNTLRRQWFDNSYDSEGKIMEVRNGFLVQANARLELYSPDLRLVKSYDLKANFSDAMGMWNTEVAPGGEVIHVQPSEKVSQAGHGNVSYFAGGGGETEGVWLRADSFEKIATQTYYPGANVISNNSIVSPRIHCVDIQPIGERARHLHCTDFAPGNPTFLNDNEIVVGYGTNFVVFSTQGTELWKVGAPDPGSDRKLELGVGSRSLDGSRFVVSASALKRNVEFAGVPIGRWLGGTLLVFDENCRERVFSVTRDKHSMGFVALSSDGGTMAVLTESTLDMYKLPVASCNGR